jgi:DegV family protein with EDD domain
MTIRLVTDSTADLPLDQAEAEGITVVPLTVFFADQSYLDGVELDNAGFYKKLQESKDLPRTSQPSPAAFQEAYMRLIHEGATGILSLHLSSRLSGTYQSACTARDTLPDEYKQVPIEIIDSQSVSVGMTFALLRARQEARDGLSLAEIKEHMLDQLARTRILAVLDTLEFLRRGGRIGRATALIGNMLSFKPIISLKEGEVSPVERPRTRSKAYERVAQLIQEMGPLQQLAVVEASNEVGEQLAQVLKPIYKGDIARYKLGAVLGTHTGPHTAGVIIITAKK